MDLDIQYIKEHLKEWLSEETSIKVKKININPKYNQIKEYIKYITSFYDDISIADRVYCILHDIKDIKKCSCGCGQTLNNVRFDYIRGHCNKCEEVKEKKKTTYKFKTGYENPSQNPEIKLKKEKTSLEHYGVKNHMMLQEFKDKVSFSNIITQNLPELKERIKQTNIKKYGYINYTCTQEYKEKYKNTCLKKYDKEFYTQTEDHHIKTSQSYKNKTIEDLEKIKQKKMNKNLQKYGKNWYSSTDKYKQKFIDYNDVKYGKNYNKEAFINYLKVNSSVEQNFRTKETHKTFNISRDEKIIYEKLKTKFDIVEREYASEEYPFACDFYIPCLDLYIEYQGIWTHGCMPYDELDSICQEKLELWKLKSDSNFYKNAIRVWTVKDPLKRYIAKKNNLNWLEFFNIEQFEEWFKKL